MPDLMGTPATYQLTVGMILNLIPPKPPVRWVDQILSFCVPPKRGSEKIIYCSKIGGTFAYCWYFCWYKSNCKTWKHCYIRIVGFNSIDGITTELIKRVQIASLNTRFYKVLYFWNWSFMKSDSEKFRSVGHLLTFTIDESLIDVIP